MTRVVAIILLVLAAAHAHAETVGITVTGPSQQLTVTTQSTTITPEMVTIDALVNIIGTEVITVAVPGPQGIPGTGTGGGVTVHNNLTGRDAADAHPSSAITGLDAALAGKTDTTDPRLTDARTPLPHSQGADTITGLADVAISGSYADLSNQPTIPSQSSQIAYAGGTVEDALDQLLYAAPSAPSVSGGGTYEIGSTVSSVVLNWSITLGTKPLTTQSIDNGIGTIDTALRTYTHGGQSITADRTYTVSISDGTTARSGATSLLFRYRRFWGVSSSTTLTDTDIKALSSELSTSRAQSRSMTAAGQYLYFCWPDTWGVPTWTVNGLPNTDFQLVRQDTFVNAAGYSYTIRLYRSGNLLTGIYSVVVS